ncbi:DUF421 domain-containing protein [Mucilaginibacter aquatilis]|uniref:DUF421 domain-containing protein n=1 Tax=Mucilaginibacter aquatilis TaxID=1517760 RepID=A0A6I4IDG5_9SPHI|nr:YetF domain-containing protein [Mucilaginibacter aquatilis]MVN91626.1 DUF421 domain-containing protein [Mucilaginibacter aquatilis]
MKKEEIHLEDIQRILFGEAPPIFLLEVFIRTVLTYIILLFVIRWLGKRMSGQVTIMEMAVMLTLGAIVSTPMQVPERGILQGVILLLCAVGFQRGISLLAFYNHKFENFTQGKPSMLVKDGVMQLEQMQEDRISRQQLFAELRKENIHNLGAVERVYLEASGLISVFKAPKPKMGLMTLPPDDKEILEALGSEHKSNNGEVVLMACLNCGMVKPQSTDGSCHDCGKDNWINAK